MAKMNKVLETFAQQKGIPLIPGSDTLFFKHQDIPISIYYYFNGYLNSNTGFIVNIPLSADQLDSEKALSLKEALKMTGTVEFLKANNLLRIRIKGFKPETSLTKLDETVGILGEQLSRLEIKPSQDCFFCGQPDTDDTVESNKIYYSAHERCKKERAHQLAKEIDENIRTGNYGLAVLCAFLGGIVGSIPSLIALAFFHVLLTPLFIFTPIAAYLGYKIGKGIMSRATPGIVAVISVLCTAIIVLASFYINLSRALGEELLTLDEFIFAISFLNMLPQIIIQFLQALLFTAVGIFGSWGVISVTNRKKLNQVKTLHGNLDNEKDPNPEEK